MAGSSVAEVVEDGDGRWLERVGRDPGGALHKMNNNLSSANGAEKKDAQATTSVIWRHWRARCRRAGL
jgi:hypothetical protein